MRVCLVCQPPHLMCEVHSSATLGHLDMPPTSFRLTEHEQVSSAVSLVLVVISFHPTRPCPDGRSLISHQLLGRLVETDHGMVGVVVLMVQVQHVLHSSHELSAHLWDAPLLLLPRFEFVFLSTWRTVSKEMLSANPIATTLPASSCSVQCVCPSGASLQAMADYSALPAYRSRVEPLSWSRAFNQRTVESFLYIPRANHVRPRMRLSIVHWRCHGRSDLRLPSAT